MTARDIRKKETEQRILDAAALMFAETGYEGARMEAIADSAGVNKAMIYYHIGDKQALYTRVLHEVFGDTAACMADAIGRAQTPSEKISAYVHSIGHTINAHPHLPRIMMGEFASGGHHLPEIVLQDLVTIIGLVSTIIETGCRQGQFAPFDPLVLHMMVIGGISYFKTSQPVRRKHAGLLKKVTEKRAAQAEVDLLNEIEKIILRALTGA